MYLTQMYFRMTVNTSVHLNLYHSLGKFRRWWQIDDSFAKKNKFLFSRKNKKTVSKCYMLKFFTQFSADDILTYILIFPRKQLLTFHANCLQMSNFLEQK